jgi:hypothetical protein
LWVKPPCNVYHFEVFDIVLVVDTMSRNLDFNKM